MTKYYKCGREFSENDIKKIQTIVNENKGLSRCKISHIVCEAFIGIQTMVNQKDMSVENYY
jgi:hypothetical protein